MGGQITKHAVDSMKVPPSGEAVLWDDATQRYAHLAPDPAKAAAGRIGLHLFAALGDTGNATSDSGLMADETGDTPPADHVVTGAGRAK